MGATIMMVGRSNNDKPPGGDARENCSLSRKIKRTRGFFVFLFAKPR